MRFKPNPSFERQMEREVTYQAQLMAQAEVAARHVRERAHRIMPKGKGEQIRAVRDGGEVFVANFDHGAHIDEYGSVNSPVYAPLRGGLREAGYRVVDIGK